MKCPNCGDECRPDSNFCMSCGTPLNNNKEDKKIISNIKKSIDKTTGNVDSYVKSDDNSSNGLFNLALGNASVDDADLKYIEDFIFDDEVVIKSFQFIRDSIILTNYGIYEIDVQGLTGKKVEVKFYPKKSIKTISFETAGTLDMDVDIKIGVEGNVPSLGNPPVSMPISFKVRKSQVNEAKEVLKLVKLHYLCD